MFLIKKWWLLLLISICLLYPSVVQAATGQLSAGDIEVECVYDNGSVLTAYYANGAYAMDYSSIKLSNGVSFPYESSTNYFYNESLFAQDIIKSASCPTSIYYAVVKQWDSSDSSVTFPVYLRETDRSFFYNVSGSSGTADQDTLTKRFVAGFVPVSGELVTFNTDPDTTLYNRRLWFNNAGGTVFWFNLVNERIYFNNNVGPSRSWAFKSEGSQAASKAMYVKIMEYKAENGSTIMVADKDQKLTPLTGLTLETHSDDYVNLICFNPTSKMIETDKSNVAYKYSGIRHAAISASTARLESASATPETLSGISCSTEGYSLYKEVDWGEAEEAGTIGTSVCDIIPETALILAKIINWARVIVPAFLIVLTGIDISRIVISGDVEEELPKRKKTIIIRLIVSLTFFFLPLLVQVIVSSSYGVNFGDISCLWS